MASKKFNGCANIFGNHIRKNPHHQIDHHYDRLHGHMVKNVTAELTSNNEIGVKKVRSCENTVVRCLSCT